MELRGPRRLSSPWRCTRWFSTLRVISPDGFWRSTPHPDVCGGTIGGVSATALPLAAAINAPRHS